MAVNDMSWLVEASRKAQEKRQQFASPSLSQHIPTGFKGLQEGAQQAPTLKMPLSPRQKAGQTIEQMRQEQAARPAVPTMSGKRLMEDLRKQQEAEKRDQEKWMYGLERDKISDERYEKEWSHKIMQDAIANAARASGGSGGGGGTAAPPGEGETIDMKLWADSTKIVRDRWDKGEDYVWVNKNTGEMIKEDTPGVTPQGISSLDITWERQSTTRVPFDSLPDAQKNKLIYEAYHSTALLPHQQGFDPSLSPSELPDMGSMAYFRSLAEEAKKKGFADSDISRWLVTQHKMPAEMVKAIGLPLPFADEISKLFGNNPRRTEGIMQTFKLPGLSGGYGR